MLVLLVLLVLVLVLVLPTADAHELHRVALTRHLNEILRGVAF